MPDIGALKKFNEILNSLGSEREILREKGETIDEIPLSEEGLPDDLSALLGTSEIPGDIDTDSIDLQEAGNADMDQLDNIEDFLMPSLDIDDMEQEPESIVETFPEEISAGDISDKEVLPEDMLSADLSSKDNFGQAMEPEDLSSPGDTDFLSSLDEALPGETVPSELSDTEAFRLPDEKPPDFTDESSLLDDLFQTGDVSQPVDFSLPEGLDTIEEPATDFLAVDESLSGDLGKPPVEEMAIPDEFSIPGIMGQEAPSPVDDFSLPEDIGQPPSDEISIPDEFSLPELGEEPVVPEIKEEEEFRAEPSGTGDEFKEDEFKIDEFSIPEEFHVPGMEEPPSAGDEVYEKDLLDEFSIPEFDEGIGGEPSEIPTGDKSAKDEFVIDEFNVPGMDEELPIDSLDEDFLKQDIPSLKEVEIKKPGKKREEKAAPGEFQLTDKQFTNLQLTLESLPRNLKIIVQDVIGGEQLSGEPLNQLINLLVTGASPSRIAEFVSKATGQTIKLPKRFEKKSGIEFAKERGSFAYMFRENIFPLLKVLIPSLILLIIISIGIIRLIVVPLSADNLYKKGLGYIENENKFNLADDTFNEAYRLHPEKKWFYKYAEAYAAKNEYKLAELKYEQLLNLRWKNGDIEFLTNLDEKGIVDYARFESKRYDYAKAEKLLNFLLDKEKFDKAALFAAGDNYLEWAKTDDSKYEAARLSYAKLLRTNADRKDIDFRFLRYFMRVDNLKEVERLKDLYQKNPDIKVDPYVYAELGGYLLAKNEIDDVKDVLFRAKAVKEDIPELHFNLSTYFHLIGDQTDEETALRKTLNYLDASPPLNTAQREMKIETYNRLGKLYFGQKKIIDAETEYNQAIRIIETGQKNSTLGRKPEFGEVYYNLGDIFYYDALDFDQAQKLYADAQDNYYRNPDMDYKQGYIDYSKQDYLNALLSFYKAEEEKPDNTNILYALGNTLYHRNDFFAAQGYYKHLLTLLEKKKNAIPVLTPEENPEHLALLNYIMRTYNNLGVTLKRLSERPQNPEREADALVYFTKSSEYYDILKRLLLAPATMERDKETRNLAYLNQRKVLYPRSEYTLSLYNENPQDTKINTFRNDWLSLPLK